MRATATGTVAVLAETEVLPRRVVLTVERTYHYRGIPNALGKMTTKVDSLRVHRLRWNLNAGQDWGEVWQQLFDLTWDVAHSGVLETQICVGDLYVDGLNDRERGAIEMLVRSVASEFNLPVYMTSTAVDAERMELVGGEEQLDLFGEGRYSDEKISEA